MFNHHHVIIIIIILKKTTAAAQQQPNEERPHEKGFSKELESFLTSNEKIDIKESFL